MRVPSHPDEIQLLYHIHSNVTIVAVFTVKEKKKGLISYYGFFLTKSFKMANYIKKLLSNTEKLELIGIKRSINILTRLQ